MKNLWLLFAMVSAAQADEYVKPKIDRSTPNRILASVRVGRHGGCSGTIFKIEGKHAWGISAAHCAGRPGTTFTIGNPDGTETAARWIAVDERLDLSLFITWSSKIMATAKIARYSPNWSARTDAVGYPGGSGPKYKHVTVKSGANINGGMRRNRYSVDRGPFRGGDSGGGLFYDGDWLVGVITHGHDNRTIFGATSEQVVKFLEANVSRFDTSPYS